MILFPRAYRYSSFIFVSDTPIKIDVARWRRILSNHRIDGVQVLDLTNERHRKRLEVLEQEFGNIDPGNDRLWTSVESRSSMMRRTSGASIITDDNMGTEWGRKF